jgi:hypothetical protein
VLVVRNELRFIDEFCDSPAGFSTAICNANLRGQVPELMRVTDEVAALRLGQWRGSAFSGRYFEHCNPISIRPFFLAMKESLQLRKLVAGLQDGHSASLPMADLEPRAKNALLKGFSESASLVDCSAVRVETSFTGAAESDPRIQDPEIVVSRQSDRYNFGYGTKGYPSWEAWVRDVRQD